MSKKITITFTDQQVLCLIYAASEVMDHNAEGFFPELNRRKAAYNAYNKLQDEYQKQTGKK